MRTSLEMDESTSNLMGRRKLTLPVIVERLGGRGLEIGGVPPDGDRARLAGRRAAPAHARVEAEPALVEVRVSESVDHANPLVGVEHEHLAEQVHRLVSRLRGERVKGGEGRRFGRAPEHVLPGRLASARHVFHARSAKQVGDQLQLRKSRISQCTVFD